MNRIYPKLAPRQWHVSDIFKHMPMTMSAFLPSINIAEIHPEIHRGYDDRHFNDPTFSAAFVVEERVMDFV
jgi:hypothetical protein